MKADQIVAAIALAIPVLGSALPHAHTSEREIATTIRDVVDEECKGVTSPKECLVRTSFSPKIEALEQKQNPNSESTLSIKVDCENPTNGRSFVLPSTAAPAAAASRSSR
jgi:hypothetical protein